MSLTLPNEQGASRDMLSGQRLPNVFSGLQLVHVNIMPPLRILISGGGIAGPAAAFWLTRLGHSCTIIERSPDLSPRGHQIDLRQQGVEVAQRMGLLDEIRRHVVDEKGLRWVDSAGKSQAVLGKQDDGSGNQSFSSEFEIMRGDLCMILFKALGDRVLCRFGVTVSEFDSGGDKVSVTLSDGSTEDYDLLIVADGQNSSTRRRLVESGAIKDASRSLGVYANWFHVAREPGDDNVMSVANAPGRRAMSTRYHNEKQGSASFMVLGHADKLAPAIRQGPSAAKKAFADVFADAGWQTPRLIRAMHDSDDFYAEEYLQRRSDTWSHGRIVLLGDTAYCTSPLSGLGTSLALVGAYVLAGELSQHGNDLPTALAAYEATCRPMVEEAQKMPERILSVIIPETALGIRIMHLSARVVTSLRLPETIGPMVARHLEKRAWKLPQYATLDGLDVAG
jgi:2-polyprenyl-6-methoxyphenol hydroxylase-like FAD-dependent oxidoreductase